MKTFNSLALAAFLGAAGALGCSTPPNGTDAGDGGGMDAMCRQPSGDAGNCFRTNRCDNQPFCPAQVEIDPMQPDFLIQQIDIQRPGSLASTPEQPNAVASLLNGALVTGAFLFGISVSVTSETTGTARVGGLDLTSVMPEPGFGMLRQEFSFLTNAAPMPGDPARWNPTTANITLMGSTFTTEVVPLVRIPIYDASETDGAVAHLLAELPLRNARMRDVQMTDMNRCIGLAKPQYNSCLSNNRWNTTDPATMQPAGVLEADITVADARAVPIPSLMSTLCNVVSGSDCEMTPQDQWRFPPDTMVDGATTPNAWHLEARFAAVGLRIRD